MNNVALFGAGRIGRIHASNLCSLPGIRLSHVCDPMPEQAAALAQASGAAASTPEAALADPSVRAVVIASPTSTHYDLIHRSAAAGKHIFCEKPVDLSAARARECAARVQSAGVACMIGFQRRFDPTFAQAVAELRRGDIGEPEMLIITSRDPGAPPADYIRHSGGIFRDMLIHDFDVFRWVLCHDGDEAQWLSASGSVLTDPAIAELGDADSTAVTIRTRKGRLCQINTSRRAAYGYDQRFEVLGSRGMLQCANVGSTQVSRWGPDGVRTDPPEAFFLQRYAAAYRAEISHFFDCLQSGAKPGTTVDDGVQAQLLADAAAESWSRGTPVQL